MQGAKDSFYVALRDRLADVNPGRMLVGNGVARPGIVVEENEAGDLTAVDGAFCVQWGGCTNVGGGSRLMKLDCTIRYATRGMDGSTGDKGRTLSAMDSELMSISQPLRTLKTEYTVIPPKSLGTMVFWTELDFGAVKNEAGRMERQAKTTVYFFASTREAQG
jgi:hypothetical protein